MREKDIAYEMPGQEVLDAAHILMEMVNNGLYPSPADDSSSFHRKDGAVHILDRGFATDCWKKKATADTSSYSPLKKSKNANRRTRKRKLAETDSSQSHEETFHESRDTGNGLDQDTDSQTGGGNNGALPDSIVTKNDYKEPAVDQQESISNALDSEVSFSIICFLSAVRFALTTRGTEDFTPALGGPLEAEQVGNRRLRHFLFMDTSNKDAEWSFAPHPNEKGTNSTTSICAPRIRKSPSLTTGEIMRRVRSKPGDACILKMNVPLQDLVRGVLRIFSSTTPPQGVSSWQPLAMYDKSTRLWSWTGPLSSHSPCVDYINTSPEAWGLRRTILNKLVECFGEWLKASQDILEKIASIPPLPLLLMQRTSIEERFKQTRNLKSSICTIMPSSERARAYFRKEENLRYSIPEQAFSYTAIDGKKSTVAPLKTCSGKPSKKIRDHYILKTHRPPTFTVLCLVRDATARLPDGMGTRSDICLLVRDSQFIMEDASDDQVKQVVSGALDRLHYELDPCIRFDKDSRLWIYLHGDREEEDFEDDCTSSTKLRKKSSPQNLGVGKD